MIIVSAFSYWNYSSNHGKRVFIFGLRDTEKNNDRNWICALRRKKCVSTEGTFCHVPAGISIKTCSVNLTSDIFRKLRFRIISQNVFCFEHGIGNYEIGEPTLTLPSFFFFLCCWVANLGLYTC